MTIVSLENIDILNINIKSAMEDDEGYIELKKNIDQAIAESTELVIITSGDVNTAANYIANFKKIAATAENLRVQYKQPFLDKGREVDSFFNGIPLMFSDELSRLKNEMLDFKKKADAEAKKKAADERKILEEEALNKAIKQGNDQPAIVPEVIIQTRKISEMNSSKVHSRRTKKALIIDFVKFVHSLNDKEIILYLDANMKAINAERSKYDYEAKSTFEGIEFSFEESVV
jgi:hypothetical protein